MAGGKQPRVPPEALSWCISSIAFDCYEERGRVIEKAHRVFERTDGYGMRVHRPTCGAQVGHFSELCHPAPIDWPACRHCARRETPKVPRAFYGV